MLDSLRSKLATLLQPAEPRHNAQAPLTPVGREYAVQESLEDKRFEVSQLLATTELGQVDSILLEIFNLMFLGWGLVAVPPEGMDAKEASEKTPQILKQLWRFDKVLDLKYLMGRMWVDSLAFGPGLTELGVQVDEKGNFLDWGRVDDWKGPEWANYLDATSFENASPHGAANGRYVEGRLLKGICYDTQERRMEYWQTQPGKSQPMQLPTGRILIIKDRRARYVDGKSYLEGIVPTALQREQVRKNILLQIRRSAAPAVGLRVKELRDSNNNLIKFSPDGKTGNRWEKAWKAAGQALKDYSAGRFLLLWEEHEVVENHTTITGDIFIPDDKLKAETLNHLIPRDWIEQNGQAVSKSSQPLWDLAMLVVDGWRANLAEPIEELLTRILEANGFADWSVEFVWKKLEYEDKVQLRTQALAAWERSALTLDRLYKIMGWDPITDEERAQLEKEKQIFHSTPGVIIGNSLPAINAAKDKEPALELLQQKSEIAIEELKYYGYLEAEG